MTEDRFSLEDYSDFLKDEDSDGHRLANFLTKKKGLARRRRRVLADFEPDRFSFDLQVVKLNTDDKRKTRGEGGTSGNQNQPPKSPQQQLQQGDNENVPKDTDVNIGSALRFRRSTDMRVSKSGGGVADRLRRYSLKRLSRTSSCRRLLNEFENAVTPNNTDFLPPICSTPMSQPLSSKSVSNLASSKAAFSSLDNLDINIDDLKQKDNELRAMLEADVETTLKEPCQKENEKTLVPQSKPVTAAATPTKIASRSYIIEKGTEPGQVILTPTISLNKNNRKVAEHKTSNERQSSLLASPAMAKALSRLCDLTPLSRSSVRNKTFDDVAIPETPAHASQRLDNTLKRQVEIPETQELILNTANLIEQLRKTQTPTIVIPIHQTINGSATPVADTNLTRTIIHSPNVEVNKISSGEKSSKNERNDIKENKTKNQTDLLQDKTQTDQLIQKNNDIERVEDELRLTDILTDSEENFTEKPQHDTETSSVALNLASSKDEPASKQQQHKRRLSSRRRLTMEWDSESLKSKKKTEVGPPKAHPLNLRRSRTRERTRCLATLNKPPCTPINGEKFAPEIKMQLARLTNYEILDLRKRNSLGRIYPISGRITTPEKNVAIEKQLQLEEEIQMEILKRNLQDNCDEVIDLNTGNAEADTNNDDFPLAPDAFKDTSLNVVDNQIPLKLAENYYNSSLVDERSCDRITFIQPRNSTIITRKRKKDNKAMPEVLQNYLNASKNIRKRSKSNGFQKRALYNKGDSDSEEIMPNTSLESNSLKFRSSQSSTAPIPIPPLTTSSNLSNIRIVSPPPTSSGQSQDRSDLLNTVMTPEDALPLPATFLDHDVNEPNDKGARKKTPLTDTFSEHLFKKPQKAAPKKGKQTKLSKNKPNTTSSSEQMSLDKQQDETQTLRRSKRGHVPLKNNWSFRSNDPTPLFQVMYREQIMKRYKQAERKKELERERARMQGSVRSLATLRENEPLPVASSTANSYAANVKSTKKMNKIDRKQRQAPIKASTFEEQEDQLQVMDTTNVHESSNYVREIVDSEHTEPNRVQNTKKRKKNKQSPQPKSKQNKYNIQKTANSSSHEIDEINEPPFHQENNLAENAPTDRPFQNGSKNLRVCLHRVRMPEATASNSHNIDLEKDLPSTFSNTNIIEYLKTLCNNEQSMGTAKLYKKMYSSPLCNLLFADLEGVEYAFYNTTIRGNIGYVRFKPGQFKEPHLAKSNNLHFIIINGEFVFSSNGEYGTFSHGDMVVIDKGSIYSITNTSNEVGLLILITM